MATNHSTISSSRIKYFPIAGVMFTAGKTFSSFYLQNEDTKHRQTFTSQSAFDWNVNMLQRAANRITAQWRAASLIFYIARTQQPEPPTPTAPVALRLVQTSSVAAQEYVVNTANIIRIPQTRRGEIYRNMTVEQACAAFTKKYPDSPVKRIRVSKHDQTIDSYNGVAVERTASVLPSQIWIGG